MVDRAVADETDWPLAQLAARVKTLNNMRAPLFVGRRTRLVYWNFIHQILTH